VTPAPQTAGSDVDWSTAKGCADEPTIRRFIESVGGVLVDKVHPNPDFENADFLFEEAQIVIELKILESEFGEHPNFEKKVVSLGAKTALRFGLGPFLRSDGKAGAFYQRGLLELFRAPLARITKKASSQIKVTRARLGMPEAKGVLWCVNDNFREVRPTTVVGLLSRILGGSGSGIDAFVYLTNHYVEFPDDPYVRIVWAPVYRDSEDESLRRFVNWLGRAWFDFCEAEEGPADSRIEGDDLTLDGGVVVKSKRRTYYLDPSSPGAVRRS
jgi:hypothetical protein